MKRALLLFAASLAPLFGDAGVLLPTDAKQPDPAVLSLAEMSIDVVIDNADARVSIRQVFANHTPKILEGNYVFALPEGGMVSDFAIWDDVTRIPGVILERKRAEEIYHDIRMQALDPGLLQMGERGPDEARRGAEFTAHVAPIPPWGNKRIEIEYHQRLSIEEFKGYFAIPLRPDAYQQQAAGRLSLHLTFRSEYPLQAFTFTSKTYPVQIRQQTPNLVRADYEGRNVNFTEDLAAEYRVATPKGDTLGVITHRDTGDPGFFEASTVLRLPQQAQAAGRGRTVVALFDASLSMQWEKLERSYQALEKLLHSLKAGDQFNVLVFNDEVALMAPAPAAASPDAVEKALAFVRQNRLRGGTNMQAALEAALKQTGPNLYLVPLGDGGATSGVIRNGKLAEWYLKQWNQIAEKQRPRTYVFAVGDDADMPLLKMIARAGGTLEQVGSTEPIDFKLNAFLSKIGRDPVERLQFNATPAVGLVYPLDEAVFPGSVAAWVGTYGANGRTAFSVRGFRENAPFEARATVNLPAQNAGHPDLPRTWAKARVDALLEKIEREGESAAVIDEIIRLARKYKFVTPYTSFLAAPRALLRPRLIRPGDPVLRVKTDASIRAVTAVFPFGLVKSLRYLSQEDAWQTRFLAPRDMQDGTYSVRLILRDREGRTFRESKTFVIASKPPAVRVRLDKSRYRPGDPVHMRVSASQTARTIVARMYGASPAYMRWNPQMSSNTGELFVPVHLAAGRYKITVTAEDFAHNIGTGEVSIEVVP
jgi:Ca-activated chloride channel family protein